MMARKKKEKPKEETEEEKEKEELKVLEELEKVKKKEVGVIKEPKFDGGWDTHAEDDTDLDE